MIYVLWEGEIVDVVEDSEHSAALAARTTLIQFYKKTHVVNWEMCSCFSGAGQSPCLSSISGRSW